MRSTALVVAGTSLSMLSVVACGDTTEPESHVSFATVSARGYNHTCGVTTSGDAYCWGKNSFGQLGDGTTTDRLTPTPVIGGLTFPAISAGGNHTCGVTPSGDAYCWGDNTSGQLGDGTTTDSSVPVPVSGQT